MLKWIESWWNQLAAQCLQQNSNLSPQQVDPIVQQILLTKLWLWLKEQRAFNQQLQRDQLIYPQLLECWRSLQPYLGESLCLPAADFKVSEPLLHQFVQRLDQSNARSQLVPSCELLGQMYEQSLSWRSKRSLVQQPYSIQKKANGVYYTPGEVINYITNNTIGVLLKEQNAAKLEVNQSFTPLLQPLHVLDPACGGGAFLLAAYQQLLDWYLHQYVAISAQDQSTVIQQGQDGRWQLTQAERTRILLSCIYGVDIDPQAVTVTKLSLWLKWSEGNSDLSSTSFPDLSRNLQIGNALIGSDFCQNHATDRATAIAASQPFDWHQAFPSILQTGGFDVVLGNPPYIDSEAMSCHFPDWRSYCTQHYRTATGNWDIFCVFIEKAIELCKPQGFTSLVVPNKLASANYARQARQILSGENNLLAIRDYAQVPVFAASVYPLVYIAQKRSAPVPSALIVVWETMRDLEQVGQKRLLYRSKTDPQAPWIAIDNGQQSELLMRLQQFPKLETIAHVTGAATVAEAYLIQDLIQNSPIVAADDLRIVNSGTIDRYSFLWGQKPLRYLKQSYLHPVIVAEQSQQLPPKRLQQARIPKIVVAGMTQQLEAALDGAGTILAGKSTSVIYLKDFLARGATAIDLRYLLGLINSRLINYYFRSTFSGNQLRGGYLRIGPPQLRQLPIYLPKLSCDSDRDSYEQIIRLVNQRLALTAPRLANNQSLDSNLSGWKQHLELEEAIDKQVYQLYRLTDIEIELL